ncbi:general odorant-binding protein 19d-like precursor [Stomoxys calcitrans]|uniref:Putative odorant binding protein n=1 Tax=Stomoxys calcitrans TaxID=35570 RepID=D2D0C8_STOCA|nr:general odorant-binding protein 19d-like precursor [Stomoxys calcitrans]ACO83218.1 putative odorant binding protein [Stomoxys calcitrans]
MKFFSVFLLMLVAVCYVKAEELTKENVIAIAMACKEEHGASDADMEAFKAHEGALTKEGKCMAACVMEKFGVLVEGKLDKDRAIEVGTAIFQEDAEKATAVVEACVDLEADEDHCEAAVQYAACMKEHAA